MCVLTDAVNLFEFDKWIPYASRVTDATKLIVDAYKIFVNQQNYLFVYI